MFITTIYCGSTGMSTITYAHNYIDRLLMFEIHVWNYAGEGAKIKVNSRKGQESKDFHWNPEHQIDEDTWYKSGCIREAESDTSGKPCAHIYYNQKLPEILELSPDEPSKSKSFFYMMTVDSNKLLAYNNFETGKT